MNPALYDRAMFLCSLPFEKVCLTKTTADGYLYSLIQDESADWVVNIDEDAFIFDVNVLEHLIYYCMDNGYVNCGMPDGGVVHLRDGNPLVTNPYFNILHTAKIRETFSIEKSSCFSSSAAEDESVFCQKELLVGNYDFSNDNCEPYYPFFKWIGHNFKTLYLNATNHPDGESTVLEDVNGKPFLIHTWYSRYYNRDAIHTPRINKAFAECLKIRNLYYKEPLVIHIQGFLSRSKASFLRNGVKIKKILLK